MKRFVAFVYGSCVAGRADGFAQMGAPGERIPSMSAQPGPLAAKYKSDADKIIAAAMADNDGYAALTYLTDHVGKRLSGSPQLNTAVEWGAELMKKAGLQNVQIQPVMVPHWVRGNESATITYKGEAGTIVKPLHMLGLGMSVGTPKGGITAPVVFVHDFAELDKLSDADVKGKVVVFNPWMARLRRRLDVPHRRSVARRRHGEQPQYWCAPPPASPCRRRTPERSATTRSSPRFPLLQSASRTRC